MKSLPRPYAAIVLACAATLAGSVPAAAAPSAATPSATNPSVSTSARAASAARKPVASAKRSAKSRAVPVKVAAATTAGADDAARKAWLALTPEASRMAQWVRITGDHGDQPFAIIDKRQARLFVFDAQGHLRGDAPILLGLARGDDTVPGIGDRPLKDVQPWERTTPAGRFVAEHGQNARGEHVIWIDYDAAVSMHPVLTTNVKEKRLKRLATADVQDNRISYGCVNVPKQFHEKVLLKTLSTPNPIVYVLPETRGLSQTFASFPSRSATPGAIPAVGTVNAFSAR